MAKCPFCQGPIKIEPGVNLAPRRKEIFDFIVQAGPKGISQQEVCEALTILSRTSLRTAINAINNKILPMRIVSVGWRYRLIRL